MNIKMGSWYLNYLTIKYNNEELALAHYNGGGRQKNRYANKKKLKNTKQFLNNTKEDIEGKITLLELELASKGISDFFSNEEYNNWKKTFIS